MFFRPDVRQILPRIAKIAEQEGLKFGPNALEELTQSCHSDIRQVLNVLCTYTMTNHEMSYDESKSLYPLQKL